MRHGEMDNHVQRSPYVPLMPSRRKRLLGNPMRGDGSARLGGREGRLGRHAPRDGRGGVVKQHIFSTVKSFYPGIIYQIDLNVPKGSELSGNDSFFTVHIIYPNGTFYDLGEEFETQAEAEAYARKYDHHAELALAEKRAGAS